MNENQDIGIIIQLLSWEKTLPMGLSGVGLVSALFLKIKKVS
jgi:hypothetical protein